MLFGSWAPFHLQSASLDEAWLQLVSVTNQPRFSRSDWTANVLLGFPFVLALGGLLNAHQGSCAAMVVAKHAVCGCTEALSLVCELGQNWFGDRVPSIWDWCLAANGWRDHRLSRRYIGGDTTANQLAIALLGSGRTLYPASESVRS